MLCVFAGINSYATKRYWVGTGSNKNWNATGNWSATSGGASGVSVPASTDSVYFNGSGTGQCIMNATVSVKRLEVTSGYTDTIKQATVYERTFDNPSAGNYTDKYDLKELTLYGNKRLGIIDDNAGPIAMRDFTATFDFYDEFTGITYGTLPDPETPPNGTPMARTVGGKRLELANHLGNVLTVVSDRKLQEEYGADVNTNSISDYYTPDIISYTDYIIIC